MRIELPLAILSGGTLISPFFNKKVHIWVGLGFSVLAAAHIFRYRKKLCYDFQKEWNALQFFQRLQIPTSKTEYFLNQVSISSYLPGRIRLYAKKLVHNEPLSQEVRQYFATIPEIQNVNINTRTGSILITYEPTVLRKNPKMLHFEQMIAARYRQNH